MGPYRCHCSLEPVACSLWSVVCSLSMIQSSYDVIVIGGGPAGSTVSTILADRGLKVGLFEREKFPRFHIGESLIPETYWVLKRIGMLEKMQKSHFVKKFSVQF